MGSALGRWLLERGPTRGCRRPLWSQCSDKGRQCSRTDDSCFVRVPEVAQELPLTSPVEDFRQPHYSSSGNLETLSKRAPAKGRAGKSRRAEQDHYETDYTTGGESCDELEDDWIRYRSISRWKPCKIPWFWGCCLLAQGGWCNLILCQLGWFLLHFSPLSTLCNKD